MPCLSVFNHQPSIDKHAFSLYGTIKFIRYNISITELKYSSSHTLLYSTLHEFDMKEETLTVNNTLMKTEMVLLKCSIDSENVVFLTSLYSLSNAF